MTELTMFPIFGSLPTEIRLEIWQNALPTRVLQLGIEFPFPFLTVSHADPTDNSSDQHFVFPLPALFSTCHESRSFCLAQYIPFASSYLHPSVDTLYISWQIGYMLWKATAINLPCVQRSLYPLALLDRIAVEFNTEVLEGIHHIAPIVAINAIERSFHGICQFGLPKELLLVRARSVPELSNNYSVRFWIKLNRYVNERAKIELGESEGEAALELNPETMRTDELAIQFAQQSLESVGDSPWLLPGIPRISCIDMKSVKKDHSIGLEIQHNQYLGRAWSMLVGRELPIPCLNVCWSDLAVRICKTLPNNNGIVGKAIAGL